MINNYLLGSKMTNSRDSLYQLLGAFNLDDETQCEAALHCVRLIEYIDRCEWEKKRQERRRAHEGLSGVAREHKYPERV